ncbi:MAG: A24 family peptidase [Pseudomonadota bacterium]|nr:A24 family peptidase [Pseudomonadota bacterium]
MSAALVAGVFGLLIGSFLNVVIYRVPVMFRREWENDVAEEQGKELPHTGRFNLMVPRSACPHCGHRITALENIPVVSYLVLRGKCSQCKASISPRYPIIEAVTGVLSAVMVWHFGTGLLGMGSLVFLYLLIAMSMIDYDTQFLLDNMTLPLLWLGLLINLNGTLVPLHDAVIGAAAGYMSLWTVNFLYKLVRGHDGMAGGDFKLLAALGAWMGWALLPAIILLSSAVGAVIGLSLMVFAGRGRDTKIPFGPYLAGAGLIALLYGKQIMVAFQSYGS